MKTRTFVEINHQTFLNFFSLMLESLFYYSSNKTYMICVAFQVEIFSRVDCLDLWATIHNTT